MVWFVSQDPCYYSLGFDFKFWLWAQKVTGAFEKRAQRGSRNGLSSWKRNFTLTVPLFTQVYKWVPVNLLLGVTLRWTSIPSRGE